MRRTPGARIRRWSGADRAALLHEFRVAGFRAEGEVASQDIQPIELSSRAKARDHGSCLRRPVGGHRQKPRSLALLGMTPLRSRIDTTSERLRPWLWALLPASPSRSWAAHGFVFCLRALPGCRP